MNDFKHWLKNTPLSLCGIKITFLPLCSRSQGYFSLFIYFKKTKNELFGYKQIFLCLLEIWAHLEWKQKFYEQNFNLSIFLLHSKFVISYHFYINIFRCQRNQKKVQSEKCAHVVESNAGNHNIMTYLEFSL